MNQILMLAALLTFSLGFTACSSDDEDDDIENNSSSSSGDVEIKRVNVFGEVYVIDENGGDPVKTSFSFASAKCESVISSSRSGDDLHVECKGVEEKETSKTKTDRAMTVSFDIIDYFNMKKGDPIIDNLSFQQDMIIEQTMSMWGTTAYSTTAARANYFFRNIHLNSASSSYVAGKSSEADGLQVNVKNYETKTDATYSDPSIESQSVKIKYKYYAHNDNYVEVTVSI
ncbi:MAG: hypothetical protein K6A32_07665 [Bacteroidales bacterium]|nr:hypothetical protein [Bacteroidales bacterium]